MPEPARHLAEIPAAAIEDGDQLVRVEQPPLTVTGSTSTDDGIVFATDEGDTEPYDPDSIVMVSTARDVQSR